MENQMFETNNNINWNDIEPETGLTKLQIKEKFGNYKNILEYLSGKSEFMGLSKGRFKQVEGYCIVLYKCKTCDNIEVLWNSRDEVTPFYIKCRFCGDEANSFDSSKWVRDSEFNPPKGMRIFVDLTLEKAKVFRKEFVDEYWDAHSDLKGSLKEAFETKEDAINYFADSDLNDFNGHSPVVEFVK